MLRVCMQVLCALVSASPQRQAWLWQAGLLPCLQRLTLQRNDPELGTPEPMQQVLRKQMLCSAEA